MNSAQPISSRELAEHLAAIQPPTIARWLLNDPKFRAHFDLPIDGAISYGGGPAILKPPLYQCIRNLLADGQPRSLHALNGQEIRTELKDQYVLISFTAEDGTPVEVGSVVLMLLSPELDTRQKALESLLAEVGPTGPADPAYWRQQLDKGPLDDENMEKLTDEFEASTILHFERIERDIATGVLDKRHLVPTLPGYWDRLCGPRPDRTDQQKWLTEIFEPHRRRLVDRELARGLDLCLAMSLRDDLTPRALTTHISNDDLLAALQRIEPIEDPFSLLGVVDLAASRAPTDARFAELTAQTVERLCSETLPRQDGLDVYDFLPALINLAIGELQVTSGIASQPAYWRRICAWTQAALMVRAFRAVTFEPKVFCEHINLLRSREAATAALLDLQECPLWHPSESNRTRLRAEVLGRLMLMQQREEAAGRQLPGVEAVKKAAEAFSECAPLLTQMPGPLEIDRLPALSMSDFPCHEKTELTHRADELTADPKDNNWVRFAHLARLVRFDEYILSRMTEIISKLNYRSNREDSIDNMAFLSSLSYIAVAQRYCPMAETILTRCQEEMPKSVDETHAFALVQIGLTAVAAFPDETSALNRLATYLTNLAYLLPRGAPSRALSQELEDLKTLIPAGEWHRFCRAEALAGLGS
jgi:hypothetical protein